MHATVMHAASVAERQYLVLVIGLSSRMARVPITMAAAVPATVSSMSIQNQGPVTVMRLIYSLREIY